MAASLAAEGFTGPGSVLEGPFGFLNVYCGEHDARGADARPRQRMGDPAHHAQALSGAHHLAHFGAGDRGFETRARLRRRRRRRDPRRRQPEDGDGEQHPLAGRPDDGAILAAVLRRARALQRCARPGARSTRDVQRSGDPRAGEPRHHHGVGRSQARPHLRLDRLGDAEGRPRADEARRQLQGHARTAARPRRDAREIPAADAALRRQGDGAAVRAAAEYRGREQLDWVKVDARSSSQARGHAERSGQT